jgi:hypothetical protein
VTTSASVDFSISRDNILADALMLVGAIGPDDSVPTNWTTHAARQLNKVVKALAGKRIGLWARKTGYILPVSDTNQVLLGPTGGHATLSYTQTTLASDAASGASTIVVTSATGFGASYYLGIELDDGTMQWTTQSGAASGTTVTPLVVLTGAASAGNYVYVYQTKLQRPLHIVDAYRSNLADESDVSLLSIARTDFDLLGRKTSEGEPNQLAYEPLLDNGVAYIYPQFSNGKSIITIVFQRPFEDFDASADTPDFPQEWYDALCYLTAVRLAPVYGLPVQDRSQLRAEANDALQMALENEPEDASFSIQPDTSEM